MTAPPNRAARSMAGMAASTTSGPMPSPPITAMWNVLGLVISVPTHLPAARDAVQPPHLQLRAALRAPHALQVAAAKGAIERLPTPGKVGVAIGARFLRFPLRIPWRCRLLNPAPGAIEGEGGRWRRMERLWGVRLRSRHDVLRGGHIQMDPRRRELTNHAGLRIRGLGLGDQRFLRLGPAGRGGPPPPRPHPGPPHPPILISF